MASNKTAPADRRGSRILDAFRFVEDVTDHSSLEALADYYVSCMESLRPLIEDGDGEALVEALQYVCASGELPAWLQAELQAAVTRYMLGESETLDQAFRLKRRSKVDLKRLRLERQVYWDVCWLHAAGASITQELFHAVGSLHGIGRDQVAEYYSRENKRRGRVHPEILNSRPLPERLKKVFRELVPEIRD